MQDPCVGTSVNGCDPAFYALWSFQPHEDCKDGLKLGPLSWPQSIGMPGAYLGGGLGDRGNDPDDRQIISAVGKN